MQYQWRSPKIIVLILSYYCRSDNESTSSYSHFPEQHPLQGLLAAKLLALPSRLPSGVAGAVPLNPLIRTLILVQWVHQYVEMRLKVTTHDKNTLLFRKASMIYVTTRYSLTSYLTFNQKPPVSQLIGPSLQNPFGPPPGHCLSHCVPGVGGTGALAPLIMYI